MSSSLLDTLFPADPKRCYLAPLFWQHGEPEAVLRAEIRQMHAVGIDACIVESRPHPDFLGPGWWASLDAILDEAKQCGMRVWVFDDKLFPTGFANGAFKTDAFRHLRKQYLRQHIVEAAGPVAGASFRLQPWLDADDRLHAVVVARCGTRAEEIAADTLADVTGRVVDGILYWAVPPGRWRVFVLVRTSRGGEDHTRDHFDPVHPESVNVLIDTVYEAHYRRYAAEFGNTFAGFFNDEPRFGNSATYEARIGHWSMVIPWNNRLARRLDATWDGGFTCALPALWADAGDVSSRARYAYMNTITALYAESFSRPVGDWCRAHGVQSIGHVVEDNGAHARLGYGSGHFFRSVCGQDASGFDAVYQIWPDFRDGRFHTPFDYLDATFFHWGLAKMASSAAHLEPRLNGVVLCELFGAYGWQYGLKMMKWLTDHVLVRGANLLVPHAFSPKDFPDPDCPPHFYARGHNPQWRHFNVWAAYAGRLTRLLSGGTHVAPALVLYHAEAEWAGEYEPFERVLQTLLQRQIDADVIAADALIDPGRTRIENGQLCVHQERFGVAIVPRAEFLPAAVLERLAGIAAAGVRVVFLGEYPTGSPDRPEAGDAALARLRHPNNARVAVLTHRNLIHALRQWALDDVRSTRPEPDLRVYHYRRAERDLFFVVNESTREPVTTTLRFRGQTAAPVAYDALHDCLLRISHQTRDGWSDVRLHLEPFQSLLLIFPGGELLPQATATLAAGAPRALRTLNLTAGPWTITMATAEAYPAFRPVPASVGALGNVARPGLLPAFSGTLRYRTCFAADALPRTGVGMHLDLGELFEVAVARLNGHELGVRICPPYRFDLSAGLLRPGENALEIDVTNTLAKQCGDNVFDRGMPQEPSGLIGPVLLSSARRGNMVSRFPRRLCTPGGLRVHP